MREICQSDFKTDTVRFVRPRTVDIIILSELAMNINDTVVSKIGIHRLIDSGLSVKVVDDGKYDQKLMLGNYVIWSHDLYITHLGDRYDEESLKDEDAIRFFVYDRLAFFYRDFIEGFSSFRLEEEEYENSKLQERGR